MTGRKTDARALDPSARTSTDEPLPANTKVLRLGTKRVLVSSPNQVQFGHFGIEMLYALTYGRLIDVPVVFVRSRAPRVGHTLFEVDSDEVRVLRSPTAELAARIAWSVNEKWWTRNVAVTVRREAVDAINRYTRRHPRLPKSVRVELRNLTRDLKRAGSKRGNAPAGTGYNRRQLVSTPIRTHLREDAERRASAAAAARGIAPQAKLVCLHVRERGFKFGGEMQDKGTGTWDDSVRNARIATHFAAIDFLVERGYVVVRIGDPTMTPVTRPGVIDLATAPDRDPLLDLYVLFRSRFILCGESGPYSVSFLTNTPLLAVNCTDPIGAFPIRPDAIYLLKTVIERRTGRALAGSALVTRERLEGLRDPARYEFVENTPEQILDATKEMVALLDHGTPESAAQAWYRELITAAANALQDMNYVRKHGPDRGYMGYGRLARSLAEPWAEAEAGSALLSTEGASQSG